MNSSARQTYLRQLLDGLHSAKRVYKIQKAGKPERWDFAETNLNAEIEKHIAVISRLLKDDSLDGTLEHNEDIKKIDRFLGNPLNTDQLTINQFSIHLLIEQIAEKLGISDTGFQNIRAAFRNNGYKGDLWFLDPSIFANNSTLDNTRACVRALMVMLNRLSQIVKPPGPFEKFDVKDVISIYSHYVELIPLMKELTPDAIQDEYIKNDVLGGYASLRDMEMSFSGWLSTYKATSEINASYRQLRLDEKCTKIDLANQKLSNVTLRDPIRENNKLRRQEVDNYKRFAEKYPEKWQLLNSSRLNLDISEWFSGLISEALEINELTDSRFMLNELKQLISTYDLPKTDRGFVDALLAMGVAANDLREYLNREQASTGTGTKITTIPGMRFEGKNGAPVQIYISGLETTKKEVDKTTTRIKSEISYRQKIATRHQEELDVELNNFEVKIRELFELDGDEGRCLSILEGLSPKFEYKGQSIEGYYREKKDVALALAELRKTIEVTDGLIVKLKERHMIPVRRLIASFLEQEEDIIKKLKQIKSLDTDLLEQDKKAITQIEDNIKQQRKKLKNNQLSLKALETIRDECELSSKTSEDLLLRLLNYFGYQKQKIETLVSDIRILVADNVLDLTSLDNAVNEATRCSSVQQTQPPEQFTVVTDSFNKTLKETISRLTKNKQSYTKTIAQLATNKKELEAAIAALNTKLVEFSALQQSVKYKSASQQYFDEITTVLKTLVDGGEIEYLPSDAGESEPEQATTVVSSFRKTRAKSIVADNLDELSDLPDRYSTLTKNLTALTSQIQDAQKEVKKAEAKAQSQANKKEAQEIKTAEGSLQEKKEAIKDEITKLIELQQKIAITKIDTSLPLFDEHRSTILRVTGQEHITTVCNLNVLQALTDMGKADGFGMKLGEAIKDAEKILKIAIKKQLKVKVKKYNEKLAELTEELAKGPITSASTNCKNAVKKFTVEMGQPEFQTEPLEPAITDIAKNLASQSLSSFIGSSFTKSWQRIETTYDEAISAIDKEILAVRQESEVQYQQSTAKQKQFEDLVRRLEVLKDKTRYVMLQSNASGEYCLFNNNEAKFCETSIKELKDLEAKYATSKTVSSYFDKVKIEKIESDLTDLEKKYSDEARLEENTKNINKLLSSFRKLLFIDENSSVQNIREALLASGFEVGDFKDKLACLDNVATFLEEGKSSPNALSLSTECLTGLVGLNERMGFIRSAHGIGHEKSKNNLMLLIAREKKTHEIYLYTSDIHPALNEKLTWDEFLEMHGFKGDTYNLKSVVAFMDMWLEIYKQLKDINAKYEALGRPDKCIRFNKTNLSIKKMHKLIDLQTETLEKFSEVKQDYSEKWDASTRDIKKLVDNNNEIGLCKEIVWSFLMSYPGLHDRFYINEFKNVIFSKDIPKKELSHLQAFFEFLESAYALQEKLTPEQLPKQTPDDEISQRKLEFQINGCIVGIVEGANGLKVSLPKNIIDQDTATLKKLSEKFSTYIESKQKETETEEQEQLKKAKTTAREDLEKLQDLMKTLLALNAKAIGEDLVSHLPKSLGQVSQLSKLSKSDIDKILKANPSKEALEALHLAVSGYIEDQVKPAVSREFNSWLKVTLSPYETTRNNYNGIKANDNANHVISECIALDQTFAANVHALGLSHDAIQTREAFSDLNLDLFITDKATNMSHSEFKRAMDQLKQYVDRHCITIDQKVQNFRTSENQDADKASKDYERELKSLNALRSRYFRITNRDFEIQPALAEAIKNIEASTEPTGKQCRDALVLINQEKASLARAIKQSLDKMIADGLEPYRTALAKLTREEQAASQVPQAVKNLYAMLSLKAPEHLIEIVGASSEFIAKADDKKLHQFIADFHSQVTDAATAVDAEKQRLVDEAQAAHDRAEKAFEEEKQRRLAAKQKELLKQEEDRKKAEEENQKKAQAEKLKVEKDAENKRIKEEQQKAKLEEEARKKQEKEERERKQREAKEEQERKKLEETERKKKEEEERKKTEQERKKKEEEERKAKQALEKGKKTTPADPTTLADDIFSGSVTQKANPSAAGKPTKQTLEDKSGTSVANDIFPVSSAKTKTKPKQVSNEAPVLSDTPSTIAVTTPNSAENTEISRQRKSQVLPSKLYKQTCAENYIKNLLLQIQAQSKFNPEAIHLTQLYYAIHNHDSVKVIRDAYLYDEATHGHLADVKTALAQAIDVSKASTKLESFSLLRWCKVFFGFGNKVNEVLIDGKPAQIKHSNTFNFLEALQEEFNNKCLALGNLPQNSQQAFPVSDAKITGTLKEKQPPVPANPPKPIVTRAEQQRVAGKPGKSDSKPYVPSKQTIDGRHYGPTGQPIEEAPRLPYKDSAVLWSQATSGLEQRSSTQDKNGQNKKR